MVIIEIMRILLACEESQEVCKAFRERGHEAFSCDLIPCSGGHPEWHIEWDVTEIMLYSDWDMMIAFPPCTDLAVSGARYFEAVGCGIAGNTPHQIAPLFSSFLHIPNAVLPEDFVEIIIHGLTSH